jgi:hypothetical protein
MRDCISASTDEAPLQLNKRVKYSFGQVLGVDDFRQEQERFEWKNRLSNMLLHGYGTVCGLRVFERPLTGDVDIVISPGYAISPRGKWIWVEKEQCAQLGKWLSQRAGEINLASPPVHTVYVKLCYRECPTDLEPIAGNPCAEEDETRTPTRTLESFRAELSLTPPPQDAEDHFRRFGEILDRVEIVDEALSPDESESLIELVRDLCPHSPPGVFLPLPDRLRLSRENACETMRRALVVWATEVCPCFSETDEDCILLACVRFSVLNDGTLDVDSVVVDNCDRPVIVSDRLKQELICLSGRNGDKGATGNFVVQQGFFSFDIPPGIGNGFSNVIPRPFPKMAITTSVRTIQLGPPVEVMIAPGPIFIPNVVVTAHCPPHQTGQPDQPIRIVVSNIFAESGVSGVVEWTAIQIP